MTIQSWMTECTVAGSIITVPIELLSTHAQQAHHVNITWCVPNPLSEGDDVQIYIRDRDTRLAYVFFATSLIFAVDLSPTCRFVAGRKNGILSIDTQSTSKHVQSTS